MAFKDKLQEYALLAEVVSAIAIIASLIFVGIQIKQNNEILDADGYQFRMQSISDSQADLAFSEGLSEIYVKYLRNGFSSLSETEKFRMGRWYRGQISRIQGTYYRYQQGYLNRSSIMAAIEDIALESYQGWVDFELVQEIEIPELREEFENYISVNLAP